MVATGTNTNALRRRGRWLCACVAIIWTGTAIAPAAPPREPLPVPVYTFDLDSPKVIGGIMNASDILELAFPDPVVVVPGVELGLGSIYDDLDALSASNAGFSAEDSFSLLFSVDRDTVGTMPPDPAMIAAGVPFNVFDQAIKGHAASDQFISIEVFLLSGGPKRAGGRGNNNVETRNNYDEGGTSFSSLPPTRSQETGGGAQDNVNGTATLVGRCGRDGRVVVNVYFSLSATSPSLPNLCQPASGANVFFNADPGETPTTLYARYSDLGLVQADDIDGLIVFDLNEDGSFNGSDQIVFSLTPSSPSLATIPGASSTGAASDVFAVYAYGSPALFSAAGEVALGDVQDNADALDYTLCENGESCAILHGIRVWGDLNCDGALNNFDIDPFVLALTSTPPNYPEYYAVYPDCDHMLGDCNEDGSVNNFDVDMFVYLLIHSS